MISAGFLLCLYRGKLQKTISLLYLFVALLSLLLVGTRRNCSKVEVLFWSRCSFKDVVVNFDLNFTLSNPHFLIKYSSHLFRVFQDEFISHFFLFKSLDFNSWVSRFTILTYWKNLGRLSIILFTRDLLITQGLISCTILSFIAHSI